MCTALRTKCARLLKSRDEKVRDESAVGRAVHRERTPPQCRFPLRPLSSYRSALLFVVFALVTPQSALAQAASTEASAGASTVSSTATSTSADGKASIADIETDTQSDTPAQDDSTSGKLAWDLTHRRYTTWDGSTGGLFLIDGTTGEPSALRFQLGIDTFSGDDFLYDGDHVEQDGQTLVASWTATRIFEVYAALENRMNAISVPEARSLDSTGDGTVASRSPGSLRRSSAWASMRVRCSPTRSAAVAACSSRPA